MFNVIDYLDDRIKESIIRNCSDLHIEPFYDIYRIRFRIDGELVETNQVEYADALKLLIRIKVLSNLDISKKTVPQDGRFAFNFNNENIDIRVSIFPTIRGEKAVLRFLINSNNFNLENIGMPDLFKNLLKNVSLKKDGLILVTGPTGSGKTTTLYSLLKYLVNFNKNIVSLEDPVEYKIDMISQTQVNNNLGLTFTKGLRSLLRQDPDIIFIGEVRDKETAQTVVESSLTGHLILSTIHTKNAESTIKRLIQLGIDNVFLSGTLRAIISQRLIPKLCSCAIKIKTTEFEKKIIQKFLEVDFNSEYLFSPNSCEICTNGYNGIQPIFEILIVDSEIEEDIASNNSNLNSKNYYKFSNNIIDLLSNGKVFYKDILNNF